MPVISYFFGITIRRYFNDHEPPHFHVEYQGREAFVSILDGSVLDGDLPAKCIVIVREWCEDHRAALLENWRRARALEPLVRIPGADQ